MEGTTPTAVTAELTLPPECYAAPGRFLLVIFHVVESIAHVIYAGRGTVIAAESGQTIAASDTVNNIEQQIQAILNNLSDKVGYANLMAVFARNVGEIEGEIDQFQTTVDGIEAALAAADVRALNGPNLLPYQPEGVTVNVPNGTVVTETVTVPIEDATAAAEALTFTVTNENIASGMVLHGYKSSNTSVVYWGMVTATVSAGSASVSVAARPDAHNAAVTVTLYFCAQQSAVLPYGEESRGYSYNRAYIDSSSSPAYTGDPGEEIYERIVTLTGSDIVTDVDGVSYDKAVAFTVTSVPASGQNNADFLVFNYGNGRYKTTATYNAGTMGEIAEMTVGEKYTMSCWARVTSGTGARLRLTWGNSAYNSYANYGGHKFVNIEGSTWQRVYWTFVFNPGTNSQYYTYSDGTDTWYSAYWQKRIAFGVCRAFAGTVQLCGFRLVHGGLMGNNTVDTLALDVEDAQATVAALETDVASIMSGITPNVETDMKATANYASGDIIAVGAKLYQATAAIASGATLAVGTNVAAITLVDYIAQVTS